MSSEEDKKRWKAEAQKLKQDLDNLGGSMRLGSYESRIKKGTKAFSIYKNLIISERHRHRYEVNYNFIEKIKRSGIVISGVSPDGNLVEIMERDDHPWFVGVQFHPELKSTPFKPHDIFNSYIKALIDNKINEKP